MGRAGFWITVALLSVAAAANAAAAQQLSHSAELPERNPELYAVEPEPLTLAECGQCHPSHYRRLRSQGGMHQFDCRECHTVFHAYNPLRKNYAELMPACTSCHDQVHGGQFSECLACHADPHAIQAAPAIAQVRDSCSDCHHDPGEQLQQFPSRHSELSCAACHHSEHGQIPSCSECHQPHFEAQAFAGCSACHDVHRPLQIRFAGTAELETCSDCHAPVFQTWQQTLSPHGQVSCVECHTEHQRIPDCRSCHGIPPQHSAAMLAKFPNCLDCHLDAHDLPVKK